MKASIWVSCEGCEPTHVLVRTRARVTYQLEPPFTSFTDEGRGKGNNWPSGRSVVAPDPEYQPFGEGRQVISLKVICNALNYRDEFSAVPRECHRVGMLA